MISCLLAVLSEFPCGGKKPLKLVYFHFSMLRQQDVGWKETSLFNEELSAIVYFRLVAMVSVNSVPVLLKVRKRKKSLASGLCELVHLKLFSSFSVSLFENMPDFFSKM